MFTIDKMQCKETMDLYRYIDIEFTLLFVLTTFGVKWLIRNTQTSIEL